MQVVVYLTGDESKALQQLCKDKELSEQQIMRQALRLYQAVSCGAITTISNTELHKHYTPSNN